MLSNDLFKLVIENTPLISIDLIITNLKNQILLGKRNNRPAQGYWFVPGGRIYKSESILVAFQRIVKNELGTCYKFNQTKFIGVFEHFYSDCMFDNNISTHYVVLAYHLKVNNDLIKLPFIQHHDYQWFDVNDLLNDNQVHQNTKAYFEI